MPTQITEQDVSRGGRQSPQEALPLDYSSFERPVTSRYRWVILGLVFAAITINYIDRMVIGILKPDLCAKFDISDQAYGYITSAFGLSYALGQMAAGRWLDW